MTERNTNDSEYDFGPDADEVPVADPAFDEWVRAKAPGLNAPTTVPRLEMWDAIQSARRTAEDAQAGRIPGVTPLRKHWRLMSVVAAALLVGVAIDRMAIRDAERRSTARPIASLPSTRADSADPSRLYRMAAAQTLTQAEALLTAYRASGGGFSEQNPAGARQLGRWGRDILSSTRLLLDSPAGDDPQLRALLDDLELVLVQIIQLSGGELDPSDRELSDRARERALIDGALQDRNLLPRIRTAVPAGVSDAASDD
jgi:hypothetical protein